MPREPIAVTKANGMRETFQPEKLASSLRRAGAAEDSVREVLAHVEAELTDGMGTGEIYRHAFQVLQRMKKPVAARYSLRRAVLALGPTGFPFERFVSELLAAQGFETAVGLTVAGRCIPHEIDVLAWKGESVVVVEAKFHNERGAKSDAKVALYVRARFDDLRETPLPCGSAARAMSEGWLVTNTKFTAHAIAYGECAGLILIGWNYPQRGNLQELIESAHVQPITCLTSFSEREKQLLLGRGMVLCRDLARRRSELEALGFRRDTIADALEESALLCPA